MNNIMDVIENNYMTTYWLYAQFEGNSSTEDRRVNPTRDYSSIGNLTGGTKYKWKTLQHNGVMFPPPYHKHNIPVLFYGERIILNETAEEYATLYARYIDTEYINNSIFKRNFWKDWKNVLGKDHQITSLDGCDFSLIHEYLVKEKANRKPTDKSEEEKYKFAIVDGVKQPVGNFKVEPPGIFIGRGCNPKLGKVKKRIYPHDVIINIGKDEPVPTPGGWKEVIHNREVEWLAAWKDNITNKMKYVWLAAHSDQKAKNDADKFDLARKLKKKAKTIREENNINLRDPDTMIRQLATAFYFIDHFALRVGNEKSSDEADTVGVTSLRVEHIRLFPGNQIELDFLGKDSIRYKRVLTVEPIVYKNIEQFMKSKDPSDELFDKINSNDINKYLGDFMNHLTAKVFRTYNASALFQKELKKISNKYTAYEEADKINVLLDEFNKANAKVAMLCNHQKNVSKSSAEQIKRIDEQIKKIRTRIKKLKKNATKNAAKIEEQRKKIKHLKAKKEMKIELKNISLGTSKINYIDPRITVSFMKRHNIDVNKVFSKALQEKFRWAFDVDENFKF